MKIIENLNLNLCLAIIESKNNIFNIIDIITKYLEAHSYEVSEISNQSDLYSNENSYKIQNSYNDKSDCVFYIDKNIINIKGAKNSILNSIKKDLPGIILILSKLISEYADKNINCAREYLLDQIDNSRELIIIRDLETGKIVKVNKKYLEITGFDEKEVIGKDYNEFIAIEMRSVAKKRFEIVKKQKYLTGELVYLKKDNNDFFVSLETIVTNNGKVIEFASDMTNWINILSALSESEYKFKQVFENSPVGKEIYNINKKIEKINKKAMDILGINQKKDLKDWNLLDYINLSQKQYDLIDKGEILTLQIELDFNFLLQNNLINTIKNNKIYIDVNISRVNISHNKKHSIFLQYQDITGRKKYIKKLERQREKSEEKAQDKIKFISNMSHEIRTPLNTIIGMTELLGETDISPKQSHYIKTLNKACDYLYAIINDILDLAKIDSGKLDLEFRDFSLKELVADIIEIFQFKANENHIKLMLEYDENIAEYIKGDTYRIRQVLFNLIGNAVKFTDKGYIKIKVIEIDDKIQISVKDTGVGINNDRIKAIFLPFAQENNSTVRKYGGTGLGLSISSMIVKKMGGKIWAESNYGEGSEFFFTFLYKKGKKHIQLGLFDSKEEIKNEALNYNILVIDDQEENRFLLSTYLKKIGISNDLCCSGKEGLEKLTKNKYNLIILDIQMPEMDGFEVLKKIREMEKTGKVKKTFIIAFTAYAMKDELKEILKAGFNGYIPKPIKRKEFINSVLAFLNKGEL
ncbi:MAG: ATP-binding protein [Candidatus Muirbacterium halophilum]|nr:ATP-binding protein [Candidatus Muirbacterium halophilum]MCK9475180.1 ATP-binding protein [Candidatus Muirbacterium halophilum]